eukprot:SAG31_NODE_1388_length_8538_cov_3.310843_1_plen_77_part_00
MPPAGSSPPTMSDGMAHQRRCALLGAHLGAALERSGGDDDETASGVHRRLRGRCTAPVSHHTSQSKEISGLGVRRG